MLLAVLFAAPGRAGRDHDDVKRLRDSGEIVPLQLIIAKWHEKRPGGRILEAELELENGRYVYELMILGNDGTVQELLYDARTAEFLGIEREH